MEASQKMMEAAKIYEESKIAFELRWMNILYEVASNRSTIILWPVNVPGAGPSPVGLLDFGKLMREGDNKRK